MKKIELLAPAGDLEKLKTAIDYGADAVYFGLGDFSLRAGTGVMTPDDIAEGVRYAHERGKYCYGALNIFAHNTDIDRMRDYLPKIKDLGIDAYLVSDPGVMMVLREIIPDAVIHLSTQANMTNYAAAEFWKNYGVKRLVVARELSLKEIAKIRETIPEDMEIEAFVHGAMCMSYSGRCLLSMFMTGRDANKGMCAHPCRYKYVLEEEKRPGEYFPIEEDDRGSYIMNSKDLCMIEHIPELVKAGISSAKIEGRNKSMYYVATVIHGYRQAIDAYYADPEHYTFDPEWLAELGKASHRDFSTGFYFGRKGVGETYDSSSYIRTYDFTGIVRSYDEKTGMAVIEQRNKMDLGDEIEIFGPVPGYIRQEITEMYDDETGERLESAPHAQQIIRMKMDRPVKSGYILRKKSERK
jgi:putative protease